MTQWLPPASSVAQAVDALTRVFKDAGLEQARLDARVIVTHVLGLEPEAALTKPEFKLSDGHADAIQKLTARRLQREPVSYLTGNREFWSLNLFVNRHTFTPRPDTETLIDCVLSEIDHADALSSFTILDLGTGSGCILLSLLSENKGAGGVGVDISDGALAVAKRNAGALGLQHRVSWVCGDWDSAIDQTFDVVVSNPPYIPSQDIPTLEPEVAGYEPRSALDGGPDGLVFYRRLVGSLDRVLKPEGICTVEIGINQATDVCTLFNLQGYSDVSCYKDLAGIDRVVVIRNKTC